MRVIVHGGAGNAPDDAEERLSTVGDAAAAGSMEERPLDAVEAVVKHLETAPRFNAGVGGARQSDGVVRTDAGVMTGDGRVGAACSMPGVEHAVSVARVVLTETPHVLMGGEGALSLAEAFGIETGRDLLTGRTRERWGEYDPPADPREQLAEVRSQFGSGDGTLAHDTVGAVATDGSGIAAATSTGGRWFALAGRIGDVPQVGAGFYASPGAAASATGEGEVIARFGLARDVVERIEAGAPPEEATAEAIEAFETETGAVAGVIALDEDGGAGSAHNAEAMQTGRET